MSAPHINESGLADMPTPLGQTNGRRKPVAETIIDVRSDHQMHNKSTACTRTLIGAQDGRNPIDWFSTWGTKVDLAACHRNNQRTIILMEEWRIKHKGA